MPRRIKPEKLLKIREQSIIMLEQYINLVDMIASGDQTVLQAIFLGFAAESISADRVILYRYDKAKNKLYPTATRVYKKKKLVPYDFYSDLIEVKIQGDEDLVGFVANTSIPIHINNPKKDKRYKGIIDDLLGQEIRSTIIIPIIVDNAVVDVLEVVNFKGSRQLDMLDFNVVSIITKFTVDMLEKSKLYDWSFTDNLTQLKNYQFLQQLFEKEFLEKPIWKKSAGLILLDIDNFKNINDSYGHLFGNTVLKGIADVILNEAQVKGIGVRYGGDEFLLVLPESNIKEINQVAENILNKVRETSFITDDNVPVHTTVSLGLSLSKSNKSIDAKRLVKKADEALYISKENGKNTVSAVEY